MWIIVLLIIIIIFILNTNENNTDLKEKYTLEKDGFTIMNTSDEQKVLEQLPDGYEFLDYRYTIEGCTLSTFHRDVTSSQSIFNTKHPVYTFITYDYNGSTLSVCPGSHATTPYLWSRPVSINANAVLFNCDLVHAGSLNLEKRPRRAVQYKIAHRDDMHKLKHLQGIDTVKSGDCQKRNNPTGDIFYRRCSIFFSHVINHWMTPYLQNRENNTLCKLIGEERCFYNM